MFNGNFYGNNPYMPNIMQPYANNNQFGAAMQQQARQQEIVRVNGKNGAEAYFLSPNSSALLLDESAPIVWLKTTDGAGYPTLTAYDIAPHQTVTPESTSADLSGLEQRVTRLEEILNGKSDTENAKSNKRNGNAE